MTSTRRALFHIALPEDWERERARGRYTRSTRGRHLDEVGFVHLSFGHQLEATANRYFGDVDHVVLLTIDPRRCDGAVVVEPGAGTVDDAFPHLYGALPVDAVVAVDAWRRDHDGRYRRPGTAGATPS